VTPKQGFIPGIGDIDGDDVTEEEEAQTEEENVGTEAIPWRSRLFSSHNTISVRMASNS